MSSLAINNFFSFRASSTLPSPEKSENSKTVNIAKKALDISIGAMTTVIEIPALGWLNCKIINLMDKYQLPLSKPQEIIQIFESCNNFPKLIGKIFKVSLVGYITVLGPLIEERVFRSQLFVWIKSFQTNPNSSISKIMRIFINGLIFGACHLSPFQGWTNLPIFIITSIMGMIFAALREFTGGLIAPTTSHILHNSLVMTQYLKYL